MPCGLPEDAEEAAATPQEVPIVEFINDASAEEVPDLLRKARQEAR